VSLDAPPLTPAVEAFVDRCDPVLEVWPEAVLTSWYRDPVHNQRVGGAANSNHLRGTAIDVQVPAGLAQDFIADCHTVGLRVIDERSTKNHIHVDLPSGGRVGT
jgi:hypothetical protein